MSWPKVERRKVARPKKSSVDPAPWAWLDASPTDQLWCANCGRIGDHLAKDCTWPRVIGRLLGLVIFGWLLITAALLLGA